MSEELIFPLVAVMGGLVGAIYDLKTREIPNWINYFMVIFGLGGYLIFSILNWTIWPFILSVVVASLAYVVAALMFYGGQWGGGDAKMLVGFGALLPIYPAALLRWFQPSFSFWPFPITVFLNIVIIGGIIGISTILFLMLKNPKESISELKIQIRKYKNWIVALMFVFALPLIIFFIDYALFLASILAWLLMVFLLASFLTAKAVEKSCMIKNVKPRSLTIGDWLAEDVRINNKIVCTQRGTGLKETDLIKLVKLEKQGKLKDVRIRLGIPFVPSFFLGLLASLIVGDLVLILVRILA